MKPNNQTTYAYPVDHICGKVSKNSKVIHACTASGKQITYLQGTRDLVAHPVSTAETSARSLFKRRQAAVALRIKKTASTYAADMTAFRAQMATGIKSFTKYIWSLVKTSISA